MAEEQQPSPADLVRNLYGDTEARSARAFEHLVSRESFGELLARVTENVVGLTKIQTDAFDLVLRNLRLAGRQDITRLARQLARTEDKLERVLQEVEQLRDRLDREDRPARRGGRSGSANGRTRGGSTRTADAGAAGGGDSS